MVEHSLGKGEVESSILSCSTSCYVSTIRELDRQRSEPPKPRRAGVGAEAPPATLEAARGGEIADHDRLAPRVADELLGDVQRVFIVAGQRNANRRQRLTVDRRGVRTPIGVAAYWFALLWQGTIFGARSHVIGVLHGRLRNLHRGDRVAVGQDATAESLALVLGGFLMKR